MGCFPWPREEWKGNMAGVVSRTVFRGVNWQKQAGLLQQMMYFQSGNIALDVFTALVGRGKQFFP